MSRDESSSSSPGAKSIVHDGVRAFSCEGFEEPVAPTHVVWGSLTEENGSSGSQDSGKAAKLARNFDNIMLCADSDSDTSGPENSGPRGTCELNPATGRVGAGNSNSASEESIPSAAQLQLAASEVVPRGRKRNRMQYFNMSQEELLRLVPYEDGQPLSLGSRKHGVEPCVPCEFQHREGGCKDGLFCQFCHFKHPEYEKKKDTQGPCKGQRDRYKKKLALLKELAAADSGIDEPQLNLLPEVLPGNSSRADAHKRQLWEIEERIKARVGPELYEQQKKQR